MAGLIIGFDEDTTESIRKIPDIVQELDIDFPYLAILTPNYGTEIFDQFNREGRIITRDWSLYNTFNAVFQPMNMSVGDLHFSYLEILREIHSISKSFSRIFKNLPIPISRFPSFLWRSLDNGYFMSRNLMGKYPLVGVNGKYTSTVKKQSRIQSKQQVR